MHEVTTFEVDFRVRRCAHTLQDLKLLAKLSSGDLIAIEARYHARCLVALYNRAAAVERKAADEPLPAHEHSLAFAQLVEYISEVQRDTATAAVFRLSDLVKKYQTRLEQMGISTDARINSTKLKARLLAQFPGMTAQSHGKEVLLVCDSDIGNAVSTACHVDTDVEALILAKAARIVRRDIFKTSYEFAGEFSTDCQEKSVPQLLTALVQMILEGSSIDNHTDTSCVPAALSLSQLLSFNAVKHARKSPQAATQTGVPKVRHKVSQETPLPLYIAMMMHAETRKRDLVDKLFHLGLCVSYDRLLQISASMANGVRDCFDVGSGICPPPLGAQLFTTAAVDNIDHNPGSTTSFDSFHGTGIYLVQHAVNQQERSMHSLNITQVDGHSKTIKSLPQSYTNIAPVHSLHKDIVAPDLKLSCMTHLELRDQTLKLQDSWLENVNTAVSDENAEQDGNYSWAAYHAASQIPSHANHSDVSVLLPLFQDQAHDPAMICHAMKIVASAVEYANPGQIPVLTLDQPLYSLGKLIQWNWPDQFGERHFVLVLGGLHIEMAIMKTIGDWLDGSGWTTALVNAHVTSAGRSESMLHASHVARTRRAHEVTAASLYILKKRAYADYVSRQHDQVSCLTFQDWSKGQCQKHPQFQYWHTALQSWAS